MPAKRVVLVSAKKGVKAAMQPGNASPLSFIEGPVMAIAKAIPIRQMQAWFLAYFRPLESYHSSKMEANLGGILFHLVLIGLVVWLVAAASSLLKDKAPEALPLLQWLVLYPVIVIIVTFVMSAIYFLVAKLLGGKAGFMEQTLALVLLYGAGVGMSAPFNILAAIPLIGALFGLIAMLVSLYNIYNYYVMVKSIHQLSAFRAILVLIIPFLVVLGIGLIFS